MPRYNILLTGKVFQSLRPRPPKQKPHNHDHRLSSIDHDHSLYNGPLISQHDEKSNLRDISAFCDTDDTSVAICLGVSDSCHSTTITAICLPNVNIPLSCQLRCVKSLLKPRIDSYLKLITLPYCLYRILRSFNCYSPEGSSCLPIDTAPELFIASDPCLGGPPYLRFYEQVLIFNI